MSPRSRWPHAVAVALVCLTWPLIWVGGLVTTTDAGMAVPDWPQTYGYNMFLYPWKTWLLGPFDLFIEHGHRLLASLVGLVAIGLVGAAWWGEPRRWVRWLCVAALVGVIFQGVLGGLRVRLDARTLAMVHGCVGPLFLVLCVIVAGVTGTAWERLGGAGSAVRRAARRSRLPAALLTLAAFAQLVLGAQMRHLPAFISPLGFRHIVLTHVALAVGVALLAVWLRVRLRGCGDLTLSAPGGLLLGLVALQIGLGVATWIANYGWPGWFADWGPAARYLIRANGWRESWVTTGHVAIGSLILATAAWAWLRSARAAVAEQSAPAVKT